MTKMTVASAVLMALAFGLLAFGIYRVITVAHGQDMTAPGECVASDEDREKLRNLSLEAFDEAFKLHAHQLYLNWMREYQPNPERALKGMINNRHAWITTRAIGRAYNPPLCKDLKK